MKKKIKNLFGLMITSIMLMLSFLSPIVAHADQGYTRMDNDITFNFTIKNFQFYGEPVKPDYQWTEGRIIVNNNWAFCVDPGHRFVEGWKDLTNFEQYPNVDNQLVKKMAIGTDWIYRQPELTINQKYALSQYYIWRALKGTYYTYTDMWITGMTEINQSDYINRADNFALSNLDNYEATGNIYRSPTGLFDSQPVVQFSLRYIGKGNAKLIKTTAENTHLTALCPEHYSLEGAVYGVYSDAGATAEVGTLTTNANGESNEVALAPATYFVKEKQAPKGYKLDNDIYPVTITTGTTATVNVSDNLYERQVVFSGTRNVSYVEATFTYEGEDKENSEYEATATYISDGNYSINAKVTYSEEGMMKVILKAGAGILAAAILSSIIIFILRKKKNKKGEGNE